MKSLRFLGALLAAVLLAGATADAATSQFAVPTTTATATSNLNQTDLWCNGSPLGVGQANTVCAYPGQLGGQSYYGVIIPATGFSITPTAGTNLLVFNNGGTLATGTLDLPANPYDGQRFCWMATHTITSMTVNANTNGNVSQTLIAASALASGVANTLYCYQYIGAQGGSLNGTWIRTQ